MKATLTIQQLYWNTSLSSFFMRTQAREHLTKLVQCQRDLIEIEDFAEDVFGNLEEFEEYLYNFSPEEIREHIKKGYVE